jgi:hypothetical protein
MSLTRTSRALTSSVATLFLVFGFLSTKPALASAQDREDPAGIFSVPGPGTLPNGVILIPEVKHDVSLPLASIPPIPPMAKREMEDVGRIPLYLPTNRKDPVIQRSVGNLAMPASTSFEGMGAGMTGFSPGGTPPDTNGDVGLNHYVQTVNTSVTFFSKTGTKLLGPENIATLWSGFGGGCQTNNDGDPVVKYDRAADRWVVSQFAVSTTPYLQCVAVSTTPDPTGSWYRYSYSFGTTYFNDYPKIGVWPDGYYITFNLFAGGSTFSGGMACAFDRSTMLTGGTARATQCFGPKANDGGMLPSDQTGTTAAPAGSSNYVVDLQTSSLNLFKFHVDWTTPGSSSFTGPTSIPVASYSALCGGGTCVPQPGTSQQLDSLADRLMYRLAYRNMGSYESLVVSHSVTAGSGGGIRWYEVRSPGGTPSMFQQATYAPDSSYRWMGSVAMDHNGDIAAGYSVSDGTSVKPGIRFAGRLVGDPAGQFSQGEGTLIAGGGVNTGTYSRWGDYSSMSVDPSDDCTFWYTTEYYASNGDSFHWQTRIGSFKYTSCGGTQTPDFSMSASPASVSVVQGGSGTSSISTSVSGGFNNAIALSASGAPAGSTVSLSPTSIAAPGSGSSTLTLSSGTAAAGTYSITVTGSGGGVTHTTSVSWTISPAGGTGLTNGGFETGSLSPWTSTGTALVSTGAKHSGTYGAQVGSTSPSTDSSIVQTFTMPTGSPTLSFWYSVHCPDTVTYDWATATLKDNSTGTTTTLLAKTCTNTGAWTQVNYAASTQAGHSVTLTLANHDDNYAGDPTYTYYDDVAVTSATPSFSMSASPTSVSVAQGASGSSTISTSVSGGFNNAISLSASGVPAGATASFSPTSIAAPGSGSSTMTIAAGTAAAGTYTITVTGSGGGITHTANVSLTVTVPVTNVVVNGGFETGTLSSWTSTGITAVNTSAKHTGTYGAMVGSTSPSTDSSIVQTFTLGTSSPTVSFWYAVHCPDTVTYDWATATLKDNSTGTTTTLLAKTCSNTGSWVQVNYSASTQAGHSVTLTLTSHDDNYAGDPTYTYYDDVVAH